MPTIALSATRLKEIAALKLKKQRQKYNKFLAEGEKISLECMHHASEMLETVVASPEWWNRYKSEFQHIDFDIRLAAPDQLKKLSSLANPPEVILVMRMLKFDSMNLMSENHSFIFCDEIQDPGNLGTIVRIADWFGIAAVYCSPGCVDIYNAKTIQATMGSFLRVPVLYNSLDNIRKVLGYAYAVVAADMDGTDALTFDWPPRTILVIGNEGHGISESAKNHAKEIVTIPRAEGSVAESLNAAISTGILCALMTKNR